MLKWTPKSEDDLDLIREHIAKNFNVDLAIQTVNNLVDYTEKTLSSNPLAGKVLESNPLFSKLVFEGNSIFYCENPKDKNLYVVYVRPRGTDVQADRIDDKEVG
jgi:plasmid stabilization system protein ParE